MTDLSKLSDADLQAIAKNDWSKVSEAGLQMLSGAPATLSGFEDLQVRPGQAGFDSNEWEKRADGSSKGYGFFGLLKRPDGGVSSEISIGVGFNGKETEIPLLVPTLTRKEVETLLSIPQDENFNKNLPPSIMQKAISFAKQRMAQGKSVFAYDNESPKISSAPAAPAAPVFGAPPQIDAQGNWIQPPKPAPAAPAPAAPRQQVSAGEQFLKDLQPIADIPRAVVGAAETVGTLATGATTAPLAGLGNLLKQYAQELLAGNEVASQPAQQRIRKAAEAGFAAGTYQPQTQAGQQMAQAVGQVLEPVGEALLPLTPMMGGAPAAGSSSRSLLPVATAVAQEVIPEVVVAAKRLPGVAKVTGAVETYGAGKSGGAATTPQALERRTTMGQLPVPIKPTKGQAERTFEQQQFERRMAADPEVGGPLRQRFEEQNLQVQQNLDAFIEETGAEAPDLRTIGIRVDEALRSRAARDKARIRVLYTAADKAGEMAQNLEMENVVSFLNENTPEITVAPVLKVARDKAIQLGLVKEAEDGTLIAIPGTLKNGELWRRSVRRAAGTEPTNVEFSRLLQKVYDNETADLGGNLYKQARAARSRFARDYEDVAIVSRLMDTKRGTADRAVALEQVVNNTVLGPTSDVDSLRHLRKVLQTQGNKGQQAWRELQGGLLAEIRDRVLSNASLDSAGNRIVSPAKFDRIITDLDKNGRLEFIYGKKGAENLRTLNEASLQLFTAPPGTVNTSNTAYTLLAAFGDIGLSQLSGLPAPVLLTLKEGTRMLKQRKLKQRVSEALE